MRDVHNEIEHPGETLPDPFRKRNIAPLRQRQYVKVKIRGIAVVIGRQFAVNTVFENLMAHFMDERARSEFEPSLRSRQLLKQQSRDEQCRGFSDQVCVGTRITRRVSANVIELCEKRSAYTAKLFFTQRSRSKK